MRKFMLKLTHALSQFGLVVAATHTLEDLEGKFPFETLLDFICSILRIFSGLFKLFVIILTRVIIVLQTRQVRTERESESQVVTHPIDRGCVVDNEVEWSVTVGHYLREEGGCFA